jgi:hypothetical protein
MKCQRGICKIGPSRGQGKVNSTNPKGGRADFRFARQRLSSARCAGLDGDKLNFRGSGMARWLSFKVM